MLTSRYGFGYGMGYSAYKEASAFASLGHSVTVIHCYNNPEIARFVDPRITLIYLPIRKMPFIGFFLYFLKLQVFLKKKMNIDNFDCIYIQSLEFGLLNLKKIKVPIFYYARSTMRGKFQVLRHEKVVMSFFARVINRVLIMLERRCMSYSRMIFVKSSNMIKEVSSLYGVHLNKLAVITGGVDDEDFQKLPKSTCLDFKNKLKIPHHIPLVLYAGRIVPQKGLLYLIEACIRLLKKFNFVVIIAGNRESESYYLTLKHLIDNSPFQKSFYFLGHINQLDISAVFNSADCLVTPSLYEPFGMVNLQAAFLDKNIITTEATGSIDLLGNYEKIKVIKSGSSVAIETALLETLSSKDKKSQSTINFQMYSWFSVAEQLTRHFLEAM